MWETVLPLSFSGEGAPLPEPQMVFGVGIGEGKEAVQGKDRVSLRCSVTEPCLLPHPLLSSLASPVACPSRPPAPSLFLFLLDSAPKELWAPLS